jgi:hypothetical protein
LALTKASQMFFSSILLIMAAAVAQQKPESIDPLDKVRCIREDVTGSLITKRKRMMDSVGHYARPDLLQLRVNAEPWSVVERSGQPWGQPSEPPPQEVPGVRSSPKLEEEVPSSLPSSRLGPLRA